MLLLYHISILHLVYDGSCPITRSIIKAANVKKKLAFTFYNEKIININIL